jgi:hypothetical protein
MEMTIRNKLFLSAVLPGLLLTTWPALALTEEGAPGTSMVKISSQALENEAEEAEAASQSEQPKTLWYYDYRNSQKYCLTPEEARKMRLGRTAAGKPCDK